MYQVIASVPGAFVPVTGKTATEPRCWAAPWEPRAARFPRGRYARLGSPRCARVALLVAHLRARGRRVRRSWLLLCLRTRCGLEPDIVNEQVAVPNRICA